MPIVFECTSNVIVMYCYCIFFSLGEMKWFDVMSFPSTIPVLVPDDSAEAVSSFLFILF